MPRDGDHRDEIEAAVAAFGAVQREPRRRLRRRDRDGAGPPLLPVVIINERSIVAPTLEEMRAIIEEELR